MCVCLGRCVCVCVCTIILLPSSNGSLSSLSPHQMLSSIQNYSEGDAVKVIEYHIY